MTEPKAARYNQNKVPLTLNLPLLDQLKAMVSWYGSIKYLSWNWVGGGPASTPINCMRRHLASLQNGEWLDPESGLPHAMHIAWNADQITQWYYTNKLEWDLPKFEYSDELAEMIKEAMVKMQEAKIKFESEREKAGLK